MSTRGPGSGRCPPVERAPVRRLCVTAALTLAVAMGLQVRFGAERSGRSEAARVDAIPPVELTKRLPPLARRLAADILWVRSIQCYGYHRQTDQCFAALPAFYEAVTELDPTFEQAYAFGGLVVAEECQNPSAGIDLLHRGMADLPDSWRLPFEVGFIHYMYVGDARQAAHYFDLASLLPGAPEYVKHFAAFAYLRAGKNEMARCFWMAIYEESPNEAVRRLAAENLLRLQKEEEKVLPTSFRAGERALSQGS